MISLEEIEDIEEDFMTSLWTSQSTVHWAVTYGPKLIAEIKRLRSILTKVDDLSESHECKHTCQYCGYEHFDGLADIISEVEIED